MRPEDRPSIPVIRRKLAVPPLADRLVPRPRVADLIARLVDTHRLVLITATAGAGKTTAAVQAAGLLDRPLGWLTLDATDTAPGRLLVYLEAAIAQQVADAHGIVGAALAARIPHAEVAGLLAEAVGDTPLLLVVDGLEQFAGDDAAEARAVVGGFVRYAPPSARVVLLSRVDVPLDLGPVLGPDQVAAVGEASLAFTPPEAAEALAGVGRTGIDAGRAVEVTGGWVTGVLFEAWRSQEHVVGAGGEADPLHGYLASQILGRLDPDDRDFLIATSLLDEVTPARAAALGQHRPGERLVALRTRHLPVSWSAATEGMRCHPRFREYLLARLQRRDDEEVRALRRRHGELLRSEGHLEEAVEEFLTAGDLDAALATADAVMGAVVARLDFSVAQRWLDALAPAGEPGRRRLAAAELMLAIASEDYRRGGLIGDRLAEAGTREELARGSATAAAAMTWCYWHLGRVEDARMVMAVAEQGPETDAVSYLMTLVGGAPEGRRPAVRTFSGGPMDALVMRVHYAHGRLQDVVRPPTSPWAAAISAPWRVGALRATGRLTEALELYRAADAGGWSPAWMHGMVGAELMIDLGRTEQARAVLARGRGLILASGSVVFGWLNRLIEAKLELRLAGRPAAAMAILDEVTAEGGDRYAFISEAIDTWRGLALLQVRGPAHVAVTLLRRAARSMEAADRILDLPTAAVYLAEALWRTGETDEADAAADRALAAAVRQGSNHQLLVAVTDFPAVVSRRLDSEIAPDSLWHDLGRALRELPLQVDLETRAVLRLSEFGRVGLVVAGREVKPRIAKSLALVAFLAAAPEHRATRDQLLEGLFGGRDDPSTRAYLRQAVHRLREALPEGAGPAFVDGVLAFTGPVRLDTDSRRLEALLAEAAHLQGEARLSVLLRALHVADAGPYLPGVESDWAAQRRESIDTRLVEARLTAARLAFASERLGQAEELVERVLKDDPYQESAWRLAMRIASALGDEDRLIATFRRCRAALEELDLVPSEATSSLLDQLRR